MLCPPYPGTCFLLPVIPFQMRFDRGTETDRMAAVHVTCHQLLFPQEDQDEIIAAVIKHGPSTHNKIERWWRELHRRDGVFFKEQFRELVKDGHYVADNDFHW